MQVQAHHIAPSLSGALQFLHFQLLFKSGLFHHQIHLQYGTHWETTIVTGPTPYDLSKCPQSSFRQCSTTEHFRLLSHMQLSPHPVKVPMHVLFHPCLTMVPNKKSCIAVPLAHPAVQRTAHNVDVVVQENKIQNLIIMAFELVLWSWFFGLQWGLSFLICWHCRVFRHRRHIFLNGITGGGLVCYHQPSVCFFWL
jgi:hypothetical protein